MPVIAMSKEIGSLDKEIAEAVARELGLRTVHSEIIEDLTQASGLPREAVRRLVEGRAGRLERWIAHAGAFNAFSRKDLFEVALRGDVVIRGWAAPHLLHSVGHIPCVRIWAPIGSRIQNLKKVLNSEDEGSILNQIRRSDRAYAATLRMSLRRNGEDARNYDLVLDTERHSIDHCVDAIVQLARLPQFQETDDSAAMLKRMALHAQIGAALSLSPHASRVFFVLDGEEGGVRLEGLVDCHENTLALGRIVAGIPGVRTIDNQLRPLACRSALRVPNF
jgi:cytidylate kinase